MTFLKNFADVYYFFSQARFGGKLEVHITVLVIYSMIMTTG